MSNITILDFTQSEVPDTKIVEHYKFDGSDDYLVVDQMGSIILHCTNLNRDESEGIPLVTIRDINNLINALTYIKNKYKDV